jgi:diguanylate cyclase (GGDEF)-like protein
LPVSILIFLGIRFSISQGILLNREAENRLSELIRKVDSNTNVYYRTINEWLKSLKNLPEMQALDKPTLRETFFRFVRNNQLESFYLVDADGNIEFDIDNLAGDNASNLQFIRELGQHILANNQEDGSLVSTLHPLEDGLFELVTRRTGVMHQVLWPGGETRKFIFSDIVTASDGRKFASIVTVSKTELDRKYLRQAINLQAQLSSDSEIIIIKEDDISDTMPRLSSVFKANLLPLIVESNVSSNIAADLLPDEAEPMLVAIGRGAIARDFLIGARYSWKKVMETIHFTYALVGLGLFFSLISSLSLITILIKEFLAPVSVLSNGARAISNGDLELNLPVFAKDELGELSTIFNQMTRRLRNRLTELTVLYNLTQKASSTHSQREIFELAAENLQQHLNAESAGTVWVGRNDNENELYLAESLEPEAAESIKACARTSLKNFRETLETDEFTGKHIFSLPLSFEDRKFGAIYMIFAPDRFKITQGFSDDEKNFMNTLRHHLGLIIENQRLFEEAITDGLTKLYLRRFFLASLDKEISRAKRYQLDLGIMLLDIDNFKKFNDTYGHQAGDHVLHETAQRLVENIRSVDTPGRYGGEEIALLLPQTGIKETYVVAERIRKAIESTEYNFHNAKMKVTVSIGVSSLHLLNVSMEQLIEEADRALYVAKSKGRNQVRIAPEAM